MSSQFKNELGLETGKKSRIMISPGKEGGPMCGLYLCSTLGIIFNPTDNPTNLQLQPLLCSRMLLCMHHKKIPKHSSTTITQHTS